MDDVSFCNVVNFGFVCLFFGFYVLMDMIYLLLIYYLIKVLICISVYCMGYFYFFFLLERIDWVYFMKIYVEWYGD